MRNTNEGDVDLRWPWQWIATQETRNRARLPRLGNVATLVTLDELLVSLGACPEARAWAEGRPMSIETLRAAPDAWVAWLADRAYARATPEAREAYDAALRPAWEALDAATRPAREAYDAAPRPAWEAYDAATRPAWAAYDAAVRPAWEALIVSVFLPKEAS